MGQTPSKPKRSLAGLGVHKKNGMLYIYEIVPGTDKQGWLRLDSFSIGRWKEFPHRLAKEDHIRRLDK